MKFATITLATKTEPEEIRRDYYRCLRFRNPLSTEGDNTEHFGIMVNKSILVLTYSPKESERAKIKIMPKDCILVQNDVQYRPLDGIYAVLVNDIPYNDDFMTAIDFTRDIYIRKKVIDSLVKFGK